MGKRRRDALMPVSNVSLCHLLKNIYTFHSRSSWVKTVFAIEEINGRLLCLFPFYSSISAP